MLRRIGLIALGVVALLLVGAGLAAFWVYTSVPSFRATYDMDGLAADVDIYRDDKGIPLIYAASANDAYMALGLVHAQDRLWQMEMMRRHASGRLAEVLGPRALGSDRFMRTLGFQSLVELQLRALAPEVRQALQAYANGVNAWIDRHRRALPPEFTFLGFSPEPWRATDSLLWGKVMALRLSGNWRDEILRARLVKVLPADKLAHFLYPLDDGKLDLPRAATSLYEGLPLDSMLAAARPLEHRTTASNAWAVNAERSSTGKPFLANDPHLWYGAPIVWYLARIEAPDLQLTGATVPGLPFHILGHNKSIAWGMTSTQTDATDLFVERVDPANPSSYASPDGATPFVVRTETIRVKGEDDVKLTVRESFHGPIISDVLADAKDKTADAPVLALAATFRHAADKTPEAIYKLNRARDWQTFTAALESFQAPQQNIIYADTAGNIGFFSPGLVPIRKSGRGQFPQPGWTGEADWTGFVPYSELPRVLNPPENVLVSANQRFVSSDYPYFITDDWAPPYRAQRIFELLEEPRIQSFESTARIQRDYGSVVVRQLLSSMLEFESKDARDRSARALLREWNGQMSRRRAEPEIFTAWLRELNRQMYADEFGALFESVWDLRPAFVLSVLKGRGDWCDDAKTPAKETCKEILQRSLRQALAPSPVRPDVPFVRWKWGEVHVARFLHPVFTGLPLLGRYADLEIQTDGDDFTVSRGASRINDPERPYANVHGPGFRVIYDLADLSRSRFVIATGQSGNPLSRHYSDLLEDWRDGRFFRIGLSKRELESKQDRLTRLKASGVPAAEPPPRTPPKS